MLGLVRLVIRIFIIQHHLFFALEMILGVVHQFLQGLPLERLAGRIIDRGLKVVYQGQQLLVIVVDRFDSNTVFVFPGHEML